LVEVKERVSRTQVTTQDIAQLCNEIRDIKKGTSKHHIFREASTINILASNTPAPSPDIHGRGGCDGGENEDNKLRLDLPTDSQNNQTRCARSPPLTQTAYGERPPVPLSSCTPPASAARTSSLASSNAVGGLEESPFDERTASDSPDSPDKTKASSRR